MIEPSNIFYVIDKKIHLKNTVLAGMLLQIYVQPTTVNFGSIVIRELDSPAVLTGILNDGQVHVHGKYNGGNSGDIPLNDKNYNINGTSTGKNFK